MLDVDRQPKSAVLAALPIFPLPNVVFLPGMVLPLNVFEPRYLELVDHVLDGGMHIGVPLLRLSAEGSDEIEDDDQLPVHDPDAALMTGVSPLRPRPAIESVFGVGQLIAHERLPDGRRFIRLEGLGRVRAVDELPPEGMAFRRLSVEPLPETEPGDLHALEVLKAQVERMAETFDADDRETVLSVLELEDPRLIVYAIASLIPNVELMRAVRRGRPLGGTMPHLRLLQRCLVRDTADERVDLLNARAAALIDVLGESGSFPITTLN